MKLGTVSIQGKERVASLVATDKVVLLPDTLGDLADIIEGGSDALDRVRAAVTAGAEIAALDDVHILAPLRRMRRDVLCTGWNYWDHFYESEGKREGQDVPKPDAPTFFTKGPGTAIGAYDDIAFDSRVSSKWDYEAEIALVIGKRGRSIPREHAASHIFGYCLANDVSQRDLQRRHGGQWLKGKSLDATMPLGPWITTADEVVLPGLVLECLLNGKLMQQARASEMAFDVGELVAELSWGMTLMPGDVLLTGTPSGIGNARTPPVFLKDGDEVVVRATGLGELRNRVRSFDLAGYSA